MHSKPVAKWGLPIQQLLLMANCQGDYFMSATAVQDGSMDAIVDKATLDCLMNCTDWQAQVGSMLMECGRVLKRGGK